MNVDSVLSLANVKSIESAAMLNQAIYAEMLAHDGERQVEYTEKDTDLSFDYGSGELQGLYTDLIQNEYSDEVIEQKINTKIDELTDTFSKKVADLRQISYTAKEFTELQTQIREMIFAQVDNDLSILDSAYQMSFSE